MLPEDIKKWLEICFTTGDCYNCPYEEECDAEREENGISHAGALMYDALNLIKELEGTHCPRYCEEGDYVCVTLGNALKEIAELEAQVPKWISVDNPPQKEGEYIVIVQTADGKKERMWDVFHPNHGWCEDGEGNTVLFWMSFDSLPEPPKEG